MTLREGIQDLQQSHHTILPKTVSLKYLQARYYTVTFETNVDGIDRNIDLTYLLSLLLDFPSCAAVTLLRKIPIVIIKLLNFSQKILPKYAIFFLLILFSTAVSCQAEVNSSSPTITL